MKPKKRLFALLAGSLVLLAFAACGQKSEMDKFVDDLMAKMTLEDKIGQLNLQGYWGFVSATKVNVEEENLAMLRAGQMGGIYGLQDTQKMIELQQAALESPNGIPLLFGMDVIHGLETTLPIPLALSTSWDMDLVERSARMAAKEATAVGVNWVFSPMVDICRDARWGRIAEGGGEDPYLGGEIAQAYVYGYQGRDGDLSRPDNVMACVKHYALYGGAEAGRDYNTVDMSRQRAHNEYLRPYMMAAKAGAGSYMSSFNEFEGIPATANHYLLTEVLREMWGFRGFVVTDATAIQEMIAHGIGDLKEVSARALQAGVDMDMNSNGFLTTTKEAIEEGRVSVADVDQACRRILEAKWKLGLFDDPFRYLDPGRADEIYSDEMKAFAHEVAQQCQVLLKNDGGVLPLNKNARIAVVGPFADNAVDMEGSWAMSRHLNEDITILQGIRQAIGPKGSVSYAEGSWVLDDEHMERRLGNGMIGIFMGQMAAAKHTTPQERLIAEAVAKARQADVVVACLGEFNTMNGEGASRADISLPNVQRQLLKALKQTGKPIVLVLTTGRPLVLDWEDENVDAILNTWSLGSQAGYAIADVLFGDVNPSAKLTTTFPRALGQIPIYYNHKNTGRPHPDDAEYVKYVSCYIDVVNAPLYPFGYGLSYTTYDYSDVSLSAAEMAQDGTVEASVTVTNTGERDGRETVQLYIHDVVSTMTRPAKELRGFQQVDLKAGETKTVTFTLSTEDLKYYNHDLQYVCEPGEFEILIGPNSRDVKAATLTVR